MPRAYLTAGAVLPASVQRELKLDDATKVRPYSPCKPEGSVMTKFENRCWNCGGKFGLVSYHYWGRRFCRKACKANFLAKTARDHACMRRWFGFLPRGAA